MNFELYRAVQTMSFLSGLKAAYDSIGSEFNKTFDSSKENPSKVESQEEPGSEPEQLPEIQHTGTVDQVCGLWFNSATFQYKIYQSTLSWG